MINKVLFYILPFPRLFGEETVVLIQSVLEPEQALMAIRHYSRYRVYRVLWLTTILEPVSCTTQGLLMG
jgi:hypothetical protein